MAKWARSNAIPGLAEALEAAGLGDQSNVRRVVIDLPAKDMPIVYVEHYGTEKIVNVVQTLSGVQVSIVDLGEKAEDGQGNGPRLDDAQR
jgi:hypothetical protein